MTNRVLARAKFCGPACKDAARTAADSERRRLLRLGRRCQECGTVLSAAAAGKAKFCSPACTTKFHNRRKVEDKRSRNLAQRGPCKGCGAEIPAEARSHAKYCNRKCLHDSIRRRRQASGAVADYMLGYKYGLTRAQFQAIWAEQSGQCAICRAEEAGGKGAFHVDHCHATGKVRGILCHNCNLALGNFKDDPARLRAAAEYLERHR